MEPRDVLRLLPDPVIVIDGLTRLVWANATAEKAFGWTLDQLVGEPVEFLCHPDDLATAIASLASVRQKELGTVVELRIRHRAGTFRSYEVRGRDASDDPGVGGVILALRDVTDRGRWEVAAGNGDLYRSVLDHAPAITMVIDGSGRLRGASRSLTSLLGRDLETSLGHHVREFVSAGDALTLEAEFALAMSERGQRSFEVSFTTRDGTRTIPMSLTVVNLLEDSIIEGLVVSAVDITDLTQTRAHLQHLANHDQLTGLPNRTALTDRLQDALAGARRRSSTVTLLYCDLDDFKSVNDRYGHLVGDQVLREVSERLLLATRAGDVVARMGGDEFVILVEDADPRAVRILQDRVRATVAEPIGVTSGGTVSVAITIGAATGDGQRGVDDLIGRADTAMYAAKGRDSS